VNYDVIVVGLGAMGSAAVAELARRGHRVLGLEQFQSPHALGSSHGKSRVIREAYFEHPLYVPLVRRAYEAWGALEEATGRELLRITGGVMIGLPESSIVAGARRSAVTHGLPFEDLSAPEIRRRFPALAPDEAVVGIYEPRAGVLHPERCIEALLDQGKAQGAVLRFAERVISWQAGRDGVTVRTTSGGYRAGRLVLAAGPWLGELLGDLGLRLQVERQVMFWFQPRARAELFQPARLPVFIWEWQPERFFYGMPELGDGVKVARHHEGESVLPERVSREVTRAESGAMLELVARHLPDAAGEVIDSRVCLYTNTPDGHFILDFHPGFPEVVIASPCSGHGFKFAPTVGEIVADLAIEGKSRFDLAPFSVHRAGLRG
jgi:sarcosine oxidase